MGRLDSEVPSPTELPAHTMAGDSQHTAEMIDEGASVPMRGGVVNLIGMDGAAGALSRIVPTLLGCGGLGLGNTHPCVVGTALGYAVDLTTVSSGTGLEL